MARVEVSQVIERAPGEVYAHLEDPTNELEWQSSAREREVLHDGRMRGGEQFLGKKIEFVWEVTERVPGKRLALKTVSGPFEATYDYTVEPEGEGTRLVLEATGSPGGFFGRLTEPIVVKIFEREVRTDLAKLKAILEAGS